MEWQRIAGILLIAGAVGIVGSGFINAPGLYQTENIDERLEIIASHRARWLANQAVASVAAVVMSAGFIALGIYLLKESNVWVTMPGPLAIAAGTSAGLYFIFLQTIDPRGGYSGAYPAPENLAYWLWLAGQSILGFALLQAGFPSWIGVLTVGSALLYSVAFLLTGAGFLAPFLLALMALTIGVASLKA